MSSEANKGIKNKRNEEIISKFKIETGRRDKYSLIKGASVMAYGFQ